MPLPEHIRHDVTSYVLRHVVPKTVLPRPQTAMEWFTAQFSFVADAALKKHLAEAMYQARFAGRLREALHLRGGFNHLFIKSQILLYASMFEALIDYFLEAHETHPIVVALLQERVFKSVPNVLSSLTRITYAAAAGAFDITPCREVIRTRSLKEIQFAQRLSTAVAFRLLAQADAPFVERLYTDRNSIHLIASAARDFTPDANESSDAFKTLFRFLTRLRTWTPPP